MSPLIRSAAGIGAALALAVGLTGCANPIEQLVSGGIQSAVESATGGKVSVDTGSGANLPADWPNVPTTQGTVVMTMKIDNGYQAIITTTQAEVDRVIGEMKAKGWDEQFLAESTDGKLVSYTGPEWSVAMTVTKEGNDVNVMYIVTPVSN